MLPRNRIALGISVLIALAFLYAGSTKLSGSPQMIAGFKHFGYPVQFMYFIGACEVAGALGLFLRQTAWLAAAGLALIMVGAIGTHILNPPVLRAIPALVLLVLSVTVAVLHRRTETAAMAA